MKRLVVLSVLGFLAWAVLTVGWAAASHLTDFPGPGQAAAGSMNLAAGALTVVELPGALGVPQRTTARQLRNAGKAAERFYRGPEHAVGRLLDQIAGHRHHHRHYRVTERVAFSAPRARVVLPMSELHRERIRDRMEHLRHRLEERHQEVEIRRETLERVREGLELKNQELLERLEQVRLNEVESESLKDEIKRKIERELDRVLRELKRLENIDETIMIDDLDLDMSFLEEISLPEIEVQVTESGGARVIRIKRIDQ